MHMCEISCTVRNVGRAKVEGILFVVFLVAPLDDEGRVMFTRYICSALFYCVPTYVAYVGGVY